MTFDFTTFKESDNLSPEKIDNKEEYYKDLLNIDHSWTGRLDAQICNTFISESSQLIVNAISLFEKGYFDCAYYSLRQSLEVSTTMIYLVDSKQEIRKSELRKWKSQGWYPMYSKMMKYLKKNGAVFSDIRTCMSEYFESLKTTKGKLNKYVHKQGFKTFYVSRNHPINGDKENNYLEEFEFFLKKCIGAVAVFRLSIDPFPLLLTDEDIYHRTGDSMTEAYSDDFIKKYIGHKNIENYKKTNLYQSHYDSIIHEEKKLPCVSQVVKNQYIDKNKIDKILEQQHLLSQHDLIAVLLSSLSENIAKVYCFGGLKMYFTNIETKRKKTSWSSKDFNKFENSEKQFNQAYDKAFISCIELYDEVYFIEHNEKLDKVELSVLQKLRNKYKDEIVDQ
jgi:hypothetical protein